MKMGRKEIGVNSEDTKKTEHLSIQGKKNELIGEGNEGKMPWHVSVE